MNFQMPPNHLHSAYVLESTNHKSSNINSSTNISSINVYFPYDENQAHHWDLIFMQIIKLSESINCLLKENCALLKS